MDNEITDLTIAAWALYTSVLLIYLFVAFSTYTNDLYVGPTSFWTLSRENKEKGVAPNHIRWAQITLKTAAFNGIQSLRCQLQGGIYYGASCAGVALFVLFFQSDTTKGQVLNLLIGFIAICACFSFVQHMRFCYHLGFLVMFQQPKDGSPSKASIIQSQAASPAVNEVSDEKGKPRNRLVGALGTHNTFNKAVAVLVSEPQAVGYGGISSATSASPTVHNSAVDENLRHIEAEGTFDMYKHTARVAYVAQRNIFNFSLGVRLLMFLIPLALGRVGDPMLVASTVAMVPTLWYLDSMS